MIKIKISLVLIFAVGLVLRFLYFPGNIYFGFDQARDAFAALEIAHGHLKLVGPPTTFEGLSHGVLYYYIWAPIYLLGQGSPLFLSIFLRIVNAALVFLVFAIGLIVFNKRVGIIAALLFAFSFEQTQFAIYMNHPSMGVASVLLLYWGLSLLIFQKKAYGLIIATSALALSVQFEFVLVYLFVPFVISLVVFRKSLPKVSFYSRVIALLSFLLIISTFILAEIKFKFREIHAAVALLGNGQRKVEPIIATFIFEIRKMISYNFVGNSQFDRLMAALLILIFGLLIYKYKNLRPKLLFIGIWFFSSFVIYFISGGSKDLNANIPLFYHNMGVSVSLILFASLLLEMFYERIKVLAFLVIMLIILANLSLITTLNPKGSIPEINVQSGMLLSDEKRVVDYMYTQSEKKELVVKGVTMPLYINTTWSYLFEWYGKNKYGYLPLWIGKNAEGFPGNLTVQEAQEGLPKKRFLVIEPIRGIAPYLINDYIKEENYFTNVVAEEKFGEFIVQKREKY